MRTLFGIGLLLMHCIFSGCSPDRKLKYPGKSRTQYPSTSIQVHVSNPRNKGKRRFVSADGRSEGNTRSDPSDRLVIPYGINVVTLIVDNNKHVVTPVVVVLKPRKGVTRVYGEPRFDRVDKYVSNHTHRHLTIPDSDDIQSYIFLLEAQEEDTGNRIFIVQASELRGKREITFPDLLTLPKLDGHELEDAIRDSYEKVLKEQEMLDSAE